MDSHERKGKVVGLDYFIYTREGDQKCETCFVTRGLRSDINSQSQLLGVRIICWYQIGCFLIHGKCRISQTSD